MKVLITGANGFLGHYACGQLLAGGHQVLATGKGPCRLPFSDHSGFTYHTLDFTDARAVHTLMEQECPDTVLHGGALSRPDECEQHRERAYLVNVTGTRNMLEAASRCRSFFLFVSTDFVFDGEKGLYTESDDPAPLNYYGQTKWEGEQWVSQYPFAWSIVRTVLVYGKPLAGRPNILTIVKEKLDRGEPYSVVNDQVRTPTYVGDLARGIVTIMENSSTGLFHLSGKDILTPYEMAMMTAAWLGKDESLIMPVTADTFSQPARRPLRTGLKISKAEKELAYQPVSFREGLRLTFDD